MRMRSALAFILTALVVIGGDTLTDFALALLIGLVVGTWSSMFTATPLAVELHRLTRAGSPRRRGTLGRPGGGLRVP